MDIWQNKYDHLHISDCRVGKELRMAADAAHRIWLSAAAANARIRTAYQDVLDCPDGNLAMYQAARVERASLDHYKRALQAIADFLLHKKKPN